MLFGNSWVSLDACEAFWRSDPGMVSLCNGSCHFLHHWVRRWVHESINFVNTCEALWLLCGLWSRCLNWAGSSMPPKLKWPTSGCFQGLWLKEPRQPFTTMSVAMIRCSNNQLQRYLYMIALFFDAESVIHRTLALITFLPLGLNPSLQSGKVVR